MTSADAIQFLEPAVDPTHRIWADLGAGAGTFTSALVSILGPGATIYAVDNDPAAVLKLRELQHAAPAAAVVPILGDLNELDSIAELSVDRFDAALLANVLHYFARPAQLLRMISARLRQGGRIVLVEYDRTTGNQWVPFPIPIADMPRLAEAARLSWQGVVAERPSQYQGKLYCGFFTTEG